MIFSLDKLIENNYLVVKLDYLLSKKLNKFTNRSRGIHQGLLSS